jgi:hypothetical protein
VDERGCPAAGDFCAQSLKRIDTALSSTMGAMLTLDQFDEVMRLRRQIRQSYEAGREDEARRAEAMAMAIVHPHGTR